MRDEDKGGEKEAETAQEPVRRPGDRAGGGMTERRVGGDADRLRQSTRLRERLQDLDWRPRMCWPAADRRL